MKIDRTYTQAEKNETFQFIRDSGDRVIKEISFDVQEKHYTHNRDGQVTNVKLPNNEQIFFDYDLAGRLIHTKHTDGSWEAYQYDKMGHLIEAFNEFSEVSFTRDVLGRIIRETQGEHHIDYEYDKQGHLKKLKSSLGADLDYQYKMPDAVGNLYRTKNQTDRTYHKGGKLLHDDKYHYLYDPNGNLKLKTQRKVAQRQIDQRQQQLNTHKPQKFSFFVEEIPQNKTKDLEYYLRNDRTYTQAEKEAYKRLKNQENLQIAENEKWQKGDWEYNWNANGSLKSVKLPNGEMVSYEYDALGRRTKKIINNKIIRYLWDNNVLLHEWEYEKENAPRKVINKLGEISFDKPEPVQNLITWIYENNSFVPCAKIINNEVFSIINDYLGTPIQAYNQQCELVWERELDIYGQTRKEKGISNFVPFRYQGQYYDEETNLCYNRFRYYDPNSGTYISKDPIGLLGGFALYGYVKDVNAWVDVFGLERISFKAAFRQAKRNLGIPKNVNTPKPIKVWDSQYENRTVWAFKGEYKEKFIILHEEDKFGRKNHLHTATSMEGKVDPTEPGKYNQHKGHIPEDIEGFKGKPKGCH